MHIEKYENELLKNHAEFHESGKSVKGTVESIKAQMYQR